MPFDLNKVFLSELIGCSDIDRFVLGLLDNLCLKTHLLPEIGNQMLKLIWVYLPEL